MDTLAPADAVVFDAFRLDRRRGELLRREESGAFVAVPIGSRALAILALLVSRSGDLVSKQEIMRIVWPDSVVEESNLTVQLSALRRVLDAGRADRSCIQTVPGRGYRFIPPVTRADEQTSANASAAAAEAVPAGPARSRRRLWPWLAASAGGLGVALVTLLVFWPGHRWGRSGAAPRLSLVVLPFENLSGDHKEDYLADAVTDDLTTDLSQINRAFVVARSTAYSYGTRPTDVRQIGAALSVRYVVEGSVRRLGDVLRVNAQLVSTETGAHLWAEPFDQSVRDLGAGQQAIVRLVAKTLNVELADIESARSRRERPTDPDAFDLLLRARSLGLHPMGERENAERIALYEEALRRDPRSVPAMTGLAETLARAAATERDLTRAERLVADAAAIDPADPMVLNATGYVLLVQGRCTESMAIYRQLLDEHPNLGWTDSNQEQVAICLINTGRAADAIPLVEAAIRRDPRNPFDWYRYGTMGLALLLLGRDEESIVWQQRALAANPNAIPALRAQFNLRLAAAEARLGRLDEAHRALAEANRIWPYDTVRGHWPDDSSSAAYAEQIRRFQAALRLAGERDHADEVADFGTPSDRALHGEFAGPTPTDAPGVKTINTAELASFLAEARPVVIDTLTASWGRSLPGAVGLQFSGLGGGFQSTTQDRLDRKMRALTAGDLHRPVVAVGFNSEHFDGPNLALRLAALGYTQVYWYRGGREAWEVHGLPETDLAPEPW